MMGEYVSQLIVRVQVVGIVVVDGFLRGVQARSIRDPPYYRAC